MLHKIANLVEMDVTRLSREQILDDFNHKFSNSLLKIDGEYQFISNLEVLKEDSGLLHVNHAITGDSIVIKELETIEKVLPKTGLYASKKGLVYLHRLPRRQWVKSIYIGHNYHIKTLLLGERGAQPTLLNTVLAKNNQYNRESIIYKGHLYLHWVNVGRVEDKTIYVTMAKFFEEIYELWNQQYQIILGAELPKPKEEKLILDF